MVLKLRCRMITARKYHHMALFGTKLMVTGGLINDTSSDDVGEVTNDCELYDP